MYIFERYVWNGNHRARSPWAQIYYEWKEITIVYVIVKYFLDKQFERTYASNWRTLRLITYLRKEFI